MQRHYNVVDLPENPHNRHPISRPLWQDMGCHLWEQTLIYIMFKPLQCCMKYHVKLDCVILAHDCITHSVMMKCAGYRLDYEFIKDTPYLPSQPCYEMFFCEYIGEYYFVMKMFDCTWKFPFRAPQSSLKAPLYTFVHQRNTMKSASWDICE